MTELSVSDSNKSLELNIDNRTTLTRAEVMKSIGLNAVRPRALCIWRSSALKPSGAPAPMTRNRALAKGAQNESDCAVRDVNRQPKPETVK